MHHTRSAHRAHSVTYNLRMPNVPPSLPFPDSASLSALRAWYAGVSSREAVERYCPRTLGDGQSARGVIGRIRRQLADFALSRHRGDLAQPFQCVAGERTRCRRAANRALDLLPSLPVPEPRVSDPVDAWLIASPQAPFPTDYVTLPVSASHRRFDSLLLAAEEGHAPILQHQLLRVVHSRHAQSASPHTGGLRWLGYHT